MWLNSHFKSNKVVSVLHMPCFVIYCELFSETQHESNFSIIYKGDASSQNITIVFIHQWEVQWLQTEGTETQRSPVSGQSGIKTPFNPPNRLTHSFMLAGSSRKTILTFTTLTYFSLIISAFLCRRKRSPNPNTRVSSPHWQTNPEQHSSAAPSSSRWTKDLWFLRWCFGFCNRCQMM